jgi:hypothetical protein
MAVQTILQQVLNIRLSVVVGTESECAYSKEMLFNLAGRVIISEIKEKPGKSAWVTEVTW